LRRILSLAGPAPPDLAPAATGRPAGQRAGQHLREICIESQRLAIDTADAGAVHSAGPDPKEVRMSWTRRRFLATAAGTAAATGWPGLARAQARPITVAHSVSTVVYGQHLVAREKKFFDEEGVAVPSFIVPGGGARVVNAVTAGQAMFGLGDSNHPLKATEKGREAVMLFATDTRCSYANIVVRKELWDRGVKSVEALADPKLVGRKAVVAATAIGSGTYVYGVFVLKQTKAGDGRPVNDHVEWVGGGASTTMLGGLKAGKFDAIMAVPEWQWAAEEEGFGRPIYDVLEEKAWTRVFGGNIPVTVGYALKETVEKSPDLVQAYVNACYRAQQWIRRAKDDEVADLLHKPYMDTFKRDIVLRSIQYYRTIFDWDFVIDEKDLDNGMKVFIPVALDRPIPYARAVDMGFVRKAQAKFKS
jgi:NitT/TauT family transport system substrate-binding protein